jgi:type IV pilus assembly protein PilX
MPTTFAKSRQKRHQPIALHHQRGIALIFVLLMMSIAIAMALITSRVTLFGEKSARNDRDRQIAFQSAELALGDAERDIMDINTTRGCKFGTTQLIPDEGQCLNTAAGRGVCGAAATISTGNVTPTYKLIDWDESSDTNRRYARLGEFTDTVNDLQVGTGVGPARTPTYVIVTPGNVKARLNSLVNGKPVPIIADGNYLVYAMGYGINPQTRVLLEAHIVKPKLDKACSGISTL